MFKLSDTPVPAEYTANNLTEVLLGTQVVTVMTDYKSTRSGSWERGFKFGSITYGIPARKVGMSAKTGWSPREFSCDHGKSWHPDIKTAKKSKGKVIVDKPKPVGEFSFDRIQRINREYYGNDYKWKP